MIIPVEIRLDENGLIRKECPYCYLEYKIFPKSETEEVKQKSYCPSCGLYASFDRQLTKDQVEFVEDIIMNQAIDIINNSFQKTARSFTSKNLKMNVKPLEKSDVKTILEIPNIEGVITNCCNEVIFLEHPNTYKVIYCPICGEIRFPAN